MKPQDLKNQVIREELDITNDYGRIFTFIDFANVNKWFEEDTQDWNNKSLEEDQYLEIDISSLREFAGVFSDRTRMYYGHDSHSEKSKGFTYMLRKIFGNSDMVTKDLQRIKHYLDDIPQAQLSFASTDREGKRYIEIRKCNFDVEISVDALKMIDHYDTFCIFSGDADFVYLNNYLRRKGKNIIVVKGGYITHKLRNSADLVINAQKIKKRIAYIETKTKT